MDSFRSSTKSVPDQYMSFQYNFNGWNEEESVLFFKGSVFDQFDLPYYVDQVFVLILQIFSVDRVKTVPLYRRFLVDQNLNSFTELFLQEKMHIFNLSFEIAWVSLVAILDEIYQMVTLGLSPLALL